MLEIGGIEEARGKHHHGWIVGCGRSNVAKHIEQRSRIVLCRTHIVLMKKLRRHPLEHLPVLQHVAHATGSATIIFEHEITSIRIANQIAPTNMDVNSARHFRSAKLPAEVRSAVNQGGIDHSIAEDVLLVVNVLEEEIECRKLYTLATPGDRVFVILSAGNLSITQSLITLLQTEYDRGSGLAAATSFYDAVRCVGEKMREVMAIDRPALERDGIAYQVTLIVGGQIQGGPPELYVIYPQGNPLRATPESPFLQIGESKYGRPILDRGVRYQESSLEEAVKYALISLDSTMRSNMAVGPPIDLAVYANDDFDLVRQARLDANDATLVAIRSQWEQALRKAVQSLKSPQL